MWSVDKLARRNVLGQRERTEELRHLPCMCSTRVWSQVHARSRPLKHWVWSKILPFSPKLPTHLPQTHTTFLQEAVHLGLLFLFLIYKKCKTERLLPLTPKYISPRHSYNSMRMFGFYMTLRGQQLVESHSILPVKIYALFTLSSKQESRQILYKFRP